MPYASDKQRRFFHTDAAKKKGITPATVDEYDKASKGKDLPESAENDPMDKMHKERMKKNPHITHIQDGR